MASKTQQKYREGMLDLSILKEALPESWSENVKKLVDGLHKFDGKKNTKLSIHFYYYIL